YGGRRLVAGNGAERWWLWPVMVEDDGGSRYGGGDSL
ncbi:hypothetical protein A2U01_0061164, partial [Trifolium medium]|nr:hypothetical protein [Trifolium medium]